MKSKLPILVTLLFLAILVTGCSGQSSTIASGWASLTSDAETAYVSFNTQVYAINLANRDERWRFPTEPDAKVSFYAAPALNDDGNLIRFGGYNNILYRVNTQTGQGSPFFEGAQGRYIGSPLVAADLVFAPSADHTLYAIDEQGHEVWKYETVEPLWGLKRRYRSGL